MCGIVGYVGNKEVLPILLEGLKRLEYRGYDSAGVGFMDSSGNIVVERAVGKVAELEKKVMGMQNPGFIGIGHTRWATHGIPKEENAHPHRDCTNNIAVAHNGIIENYQELKNKLSARGHVFRSETDTEVIAHLLEEEPESLLLEERLARVAQKLIGTYGLAVLDARSPEKIVAMRLGSPLVLGLKDDEYFIASDPAAFISHTRDVLYLDDGEIVVLTPQGIHILEGGVQKEKEVQTLEWDVMKIEKQGFPHFMLKEIHEQPKVIEDVLRGRVDSKEGLAHLGGLRDVEKKLREAKRLIIVGCGSAFYAGSIGKYMLEEYAGIAVDCEIASEFRYRSPVFDEGTVVLAVSQSGETADTLAAVHEAKRKGVLTLGMVNVVGSTIARETDAGIYTHAGPEIGVASTKAFVSQVAAFALLTLFLGRQRNMTSVMGKHIIDELAELPEKIRTVLSQQKNIEKIAQKYADAHNFLYIGRKYNAPIALEAALKMKEISYIHAEGYPAGEMKHGPIALLDPSFPVIAFAPKNSVYEKMKSAIEEIRARQAPILVITTEGNTEFANGANDVILVPKTTEMLEPIVNIVPLQLLAYFIAVAKGLDPDQPRNLAKAVTVE